MLLCLANRNSSTFVVSGNHRASAARFIFGGKESNRLLVPLSLLSFLWLGGAHLHEDSENQKKLFCLKTQSSQAFSFSSLYHFNHCFKNINPGVTQNYKLYKYIKPVLRRGSTVWTEGLWTPLWAPRFKYLHHHRQWTLGALSNFSVP